MSRRRSSPRCRRCPKCSKRSRCGFEAAQVAKAAILGFPENREINREFLLFCPRAAVLDVDFCNYFKTLQAYSLLEANRELMHPTMEFDRPDRVFCFTRGRGSPKHLQSYNDSPISANN